MLFLYQSPGNIRHVCYFPLRVTLQAGAIKDNELNKMTIVLQYEFSRNVFFRLEIRANLVELNRSV